MKCPCAFSQVHSVRRGGVGFWPAVALLAAAAGLQAADDFVINTFDTAVEASQWSRWWGSAMQTYEWDGAVDADSNPNSGSLKVTVQFNLAAYGGDNQFAALRNFGSLDGSQYTNLVMDLLWDPGSPQRSFGDFGYLEPGFRNLDFTQDWLRAGAVPTNGGWIHLVLPINPNAPKIDTIAGVVLKMWSGDPTWGQTGRAVFWVDNVKLIARPEIGTPPPTLGLERPTPGLRIFASAPGSQYQRQSIRTVNPAYSWVGASDPVTYSLTISDYPGSAYSGFQTHLFLVPGTGIPTYENSPDWNEPNVVFLQIANNMDGSSYGAFRYKTNLPNGNSMLFGNGTLAAIGSPQIRGSWNLTFNPSGEIILTTPSGASTNFTMPPDAVSLFSGSTYAYFGAQPNSFGAIGQSLTLAHLQVTGVGNPIDETFSAPTLDPNLWQVIAEDTAGLIPVPPDAVFWVTWTLPDRGFTSQVVDDFQLAIDGLWSDFPLMSTQIGDLKRALILQSQLPPSFTGNYFFRLVK